MSAAAPPSNAAPTTATVSAPGETVKAIVSMLIAAHCLAVVCGLFAYHRPTSELAARAYGFFLPYLGVLHLDPGFAQLELATGDPLGDNHFLRAIFLPPLDAGSDTPIATVDFPNEESRWGLERRRWIAAATDGADFARTENEQTTAGYARPIAKRLLLERDARRCRLQFIHKKSPPLDATTSPELPADDLRAAVYFEVVYEFEAWFDAENRFHMQQRSKPRELAPKPKLNIDETVPSDDRATSDEDVP